MQIPRLLGMTSVLEGCWSLPRTCEFLYFVLHTITQSHNCPCARPWALRQSPLTILIPASFGSGALPGTADGLESHSPAPPWAASSSHPQGLGIGNPRSQAFFVG